MRGLDSYTQLDKSGLWIPQGPFVKCPSKTKFPRKLPSFGLLINPLIIECAVSFDTIAVGGTASGTSYTISVIIGATANLVIVGAGCYSGDNSTEVAIGANNFSRIGTNVSRSEANMQLWGLLNPPTGAQTITVTQNSDSGAGGAISFIGANASLTLDSNATGTTGSGANPTQGITTVADLALPFLFTYWGGLGLPTASSFAHEAHSTVGGVENAGAACDNAKTPAGAVTHTWTATGAPYAQAGGSVKAGVTFSPEEDYYIRKLPVSLDNNVVLYL